MQAPNSKSYIYDGKNKQTSYKENNVEKGGYSYDGDGRRVKRVAAGVTTIYVYNISGQLIAEYSDANQAGSGGTSYLTSDHLGSTRVLTDSTGSVKDRHDYLPFGEEIASYVSGRANVGAQDYKVGDLRQKFTQKERDLESGLDYFGARYNSSSQGRFTSADPLLTSGRTAIPQSWNRYTYTVNNPLNYIDPKGLDWGYYDYIENGKKRSYYHYFQGKVGSYKVGGNLQKFTAVNFCKQGYLDVTVPSSGVQVRLSNNPNNLFRVLSAPRATDNHGENFGDGSLYAGRLIQETARQTAAIPHATAAFMG